MTPEELDALPGNSVVLRNNAEPFIAGMHGRRDGLKRLWSNTGGGCFDSLWMAREPTVLLWSPEVTS